MGRTVVTSSGLIVLFILAQSTWFHAIEVFGVVPDMALIVLIYVSFRNAGAEGQIAGFIAGIVQDFISAAPLGLNVFVKTVVGFAYGLIAGNFYVDRFLLPLLFGAAGTILKALSIAILAFVFPAHVHSYDFGGMTLWIETAYNAFLTPVLFFVLGLMGNLLTTVRSRG
ncbi:MAG: rod shape-determining protein MreD [Spirochaetes bacterium]|nr:rod shape-determining protein MreD [Spirochaetota bacterium]